MLDRLAPALQQLIVGRLPPTAHAQLSLVCRAWRHLPHQQLTRLVVGQQLRLPAAQLRHCCNLQRVVLEDPASSQEACRSVLEQLARVKLPRLRLLAVAYSSSAMQELYDRIVVAQQVQGCQLQLTATNRATLAELASRSMPALALLEVNLPYLFEHGLDMIGDAAALQGPACAVSLWVCCWGGCTGLALADARRLHARLPPGQLVGLEAINLTHPSDMASIAHLTGLTALGVNAKPLLALQQQPAAAPAAAPGAAAAGASTAEAAAPDGAGHSGLAGTLLDPIGGLASLRQLTLHGSPPGGWQGAHALSHLTRLSKLAVLSEQGSAPLALQPFIPALEACLRHLAVERSSIGTDLECLSCLTGLNALSLKLTNVDPPAAGSDAYHALCAGWLGGSDTEEGAGDTSTSSSSSSSSHGSAGGAHSDGGSCREAAVVSGVQQLALAGGQQLVQERLQPPADPGMVDLSWLQHLTCLRSASLEVPQLELTHLPASLEELDAQKLSSSAATWVTCAGCECSAPPAAGGASACADPPLQLPRLRQLLLPFHGHGCSPDYLDAVVLAVAAGGCPELREVDLVGWEVSEAAAGAAARQLPRLRTLRLATPPGLEDSPAAWQRLAQRLQALRQAGGPQLQLGRHQAVRMYPFALVQSL